MITNDTIQNLYATYATAPELFEDRGLTGLMDFAFDSDAIDFDGDRLVFTAEPAHSPFRSVELERVWGASDLGHHMALVMPNSIIFVNKHDHSLRVHLKEVEQED